MEKGTILIISNEEEKSNSIKAKIKLLRGYDSVRIVSYIEAISVLNTTMPSIIIVYCEPNNPLTIVKEIRAIGYLDKVPILYVEDTFNEEKLLAAFDYGIDDFFYLDNADSILLMRILLLLQKKTLYQKIDIGREILVSTNIIDKHIDIYTKEKAPIVLKTFFRKSIEENCKDTVFMYIRMLSKDGNRLNLNKISKKIRSMLRADDVIAYGKSSGFYLVIYDAGLVGAQAVHNKIQAVFSSEYDIYSCAAIINRSFEEMENVFYLKMKSQIEQNSEFKFLSEADYREMSVNPEIQDEKQILFRDFKKEFLKRFEPIVAPVFYSVQTANISKFVDSEIKYYVNETESKFYVTGKGKTAELTITYPTYMNILIDVRHYDEAGNTYVRRHTVEFEDFSEEKLTKLLNDMIEKFLEDSKVNAEANTEVKTEASTEAS